MMHSFPRTFTPARRAGKSDLLHTVSRAFGPMIPAAYLRLRREAAGLTLEQAAARLATVKDAVPVAIDLLRRLETPGMTARLPDTLKRLRTVFPFDPDVYRQLANEPADRHPLVCRGCGASEWDRPEAVDGKLAFAWATPNLCNRCVDAAPRFGSFQ